MFAEEACFDCEGRGCDTCNDMLYTREAIALQMDAGTGLDGGPCPRNGPPRAGTENLASGADETKWERIQQLRALLLSQASLREQSESVVAAILADIGGADEDDPVPDWIEEANVALGVEGMTVGELRWRLRLTLEEIADNERRS